jgi:transcriptional regulator with XRE-family HTH domain
MANEPKNFAETVHGVRHQSGISQEELAHELGVSFSTISRWENGKTIPLKLARKQFEAFRDLMAEQGRLKLENTDINS